MPLSLGWLLTWQARSLSHLYTARAITGVGIGAGVPIASIYLREISTPQLRGTLTILMPAAANTGNLLMYILGWLLAVAEAGLWEKQLLEDLGIESNYNSMERPVHNENHSVPLQIHLE